MKTIDTQTLRQKLDQGDDLTLVNTLSEDAFKTTKIPGAVNIPRESDDFAEQVEQKAGGKDKPVVVYCASEDCDSSPKAAQQLEQAGFDNVMDYEGGAKAWQEAGNTLEAVTS